ncbi:MAG: DNA polymerase I, partial [Deferrisomatales bacterium]
PAEVVERLGVRPDQVVDLLSLTGDAVDNVPGVPGVGPKTAAQWLERHGSLEEVVAHAGEVKGKRGEALREWAPRVLANRELVTIRTDLELGLSAADLAPGPWDRPALAALYRELEFHRLLQDLGPAPEAPRPAAPDRPGAPPGWVALVAEESGAPWGLASSTGEALAADPDGLPGDWAGRLADPEVPVVGWGLKAARRELLGRGAELRGIRLDGGVAAYLLAPGRRAYPLDEAARDRGLADPGPEPAARAQTALALAPRLEADLAEAGLLELYRTIENPLIPILADMEARGVKVDARALVALGAEYAGRLAELERRLFDQAGEVFNPQSPKQLARVLFEVLKLPATKKTTTGYSTDASVLEELALHHPVPALVVEHRSLAKLKSSFIDVLPGLVDPHTGRVHTRFHQTVAATGRLSSSDPNLQNVPVKGDEGRRIREAFVAEPGCRLLSADYSQVELRVLAHLCGDEALVEVFRAGRDVHAETAARIFGVAPAAVDARMRREAKTVNFGILYGMSPFGLARQLGIGREAARAMIDAYFRQFPAVREFLDRLVARARDTGWAETLFGRRRAIPELASRNRVQREFGERMAVNTPIQGTAADLIKRAMVGACGALAQAGLGARLILQVHDELVFEVAEAEVDEARERVVAAMESAAELRVPLRVDSGTGANWYQAHGGGG